MPWKMALSKLTLSKLALLKLALTKLACRCVVLHFPSPLNADRTWSSLNNSRTPTVPQDCACGPQAYYHATQTSIVIMCLIISSRMEYRGRHGRCTSYVYGRIAGKSSNAITSCVIYAKYTFSISEGWAMLCRVEFLRINSRSHSSCMPFITFFPRGPPRSYAVCSSRIPGRPSCYYAPGDSRRR